LLQSQEPWHETHGWETFSKLLSTAPAFIVGQRCAVVDLDEPALLANGHALSEIYDNGHIWSPPEYGVRPMKHGYRTPEFR
jgi:hypothetical protein